MKPLENKKNEEIYMSMFIGIINCVGGKWIDREIEKMEANHKAEQKTEDDKEKNGKSEGDEEPEVTISFKNKFRYINKTVWEGIRIFTLNRVSEPIKPETKPFEKSHIKVKYACGNKEKEVYIGMNTAGEIDIPVMEELEAIYKHQEYRLQSFKCEKMLENKISGKVLLSYCFLDEEGIERYDILSLWKSKGRRILLVLQCRASKKRNGNREPARRRKQNYGK